MTGTVEFYQDDLIVVSMEESMCNMIGLVTKEKPQGLPLEMKKPENSEEGQEKKDTDTEEEDGSMSDGNLYDPPQVESVNVSWFIHSNILEINDTFNMLPYIESVPGSKLTLLDRSIAVSDIVKMDFNGITKVGTVSALKIRADVLVIGQDRIIRNIDCSRLKWIEPYMGKNLETNFTYNSWLGEVLEINFDVILNFVDGARLKVPGICLNDFDNTISHIWNPEIILEGCIMEGNASDLKSRKAKFLHETVKYNSKWLSKCKDEFVQILIEKVVPAQADMQWVFGYNNKESNIVPESPPLTLKAKDIDKLEQVHPYPWHSLGVGDIWYYRLSEEDKMIEINSDDSMEKVMYKLMNNQLNERTVQKDIEKDDIEIEQVPSSKAADNQITNTCIVKPRKKILCSVRNRNKRRQMSSINSKVNVSSEDGTESEEDDFDPKKNGESIVTEMNHINSQRDNNLELLKKEAFSKLKPNNMFPVGILLTKCSVDVSWQDGTKSYDVATTKLLPQMYSIDEHDFFPGDFIVQKFDALNINNDQVKHYFGTVLKADSKDRVATVQWFDYDQNDSVTGKLTKSGQPETIGVYDISALNEHHFVLGQEVIIKEEVAHKNYPAAFVIRLEPDDGMLVVRWPDGTENAMSPTDLLLTVESAIGGGSASSEDSDCDDSDNSTSALSSESDSADWETVEEVEANQEDESYIAKLSCARKGLVDLQEQIKKVQSLMGTVTDFTLIVQANLPSFTGQLINVKDLFSDEDNELLNEKESLFKGKVLDGYQDDEINIPLKLSVDEGKNVDVSLPDQQFAIRTLYEIRQNIGLIYKQCNDVEIKRMFRCYRPKDFLSFRLIKNFIHCNVQFKQNSSTSFGINDRESPLKQNGDVYASLDSIKHQETGNVIIHDSELDNNKDKKSQEVVAEYLKTQYKNIKSNLQFLTESINMWLLEKSCYFKDDPCDDMKEEEVKFKEPKESLTEEKLMMDDNVCVEDQPKDVLSTDPFFPIDNADDNLVSGEDQKPNALVINHTDSSDHTMSTCDPIPVEQRGQFIMEESVSSSHKFILSPRPSLSNLKFSKAWKRDIKLLSTSLPKGVVVKSFDDRIDLFSVMIVGPSGTPYEHALFFFDIQLGVQYPTTQPSVFYISLASERVNPNLYTEGRVCLSLLGTWNGKGTENWDSKLSSLLQLIVSLQGLILVSEPYYNEAGFEIRKGSEEGKENSQKYNENAINNICQSMINLLQRPIPIFEKEITDHFKEHGQSLIDIHQYWSSLDEGNLTRNGATLTLPDFPLAPVSKGFQLSLQKHVTTLKKRLSEKEVEWRNELI